MSSEFQFWSNSVPLRLAHDWTLTLLLSYLGVTLHMVCKACQGHTPQLIYPFISYEENEALWLWLKGINIWQKIQESFNKYSYENLKCNYGQFYETVVALSLLNGPNKLERL